MKTLTVLFGFCATMSLQAQVGIGNSTPNANAILDLTNSNDQGLVLPILLGSMPTTPTGLVFFESGDSVIYYTMGNSNYNALSPWKYKYNGAISDDVYYVNSGNIGIGLSNPPTKFTITGGTDAAGASGSNGYLLMGDFSGTHMVLDDDEIIAKTDGVTSGTLYLQNDGGSVNIGNSTTANLTVNGSINTTDRVKEDNADLLPAGTIVMWSGSTAPTGWALCNGSTYTKTDGTGSITAPDLRDRFIVGAGTSYTVGNTGGSTSNSHTHDVDPPSTTTSSNGAHTHTGTTDDPSGTYKACGCPAGSNNTASDNHDHTFTTDSNGAHTHTLNISSFTSGSSSTSENRPPYYALTYIMKL